MLRTLRRVAFVWAVCIGLAVYVAPDVPRSHLKKYLTTHQRPQYEYENGQIPVGVQLATAALETLDSMLPPKGNTRSSISANRGVVNNPQDAFFRNSSDIRPDVYADQWKSPATVRSSSSSKPSFDVGPAVQANPFARDMQ